MDGSGHPKRQPEGSNLMPESKAIIRCPKCGSHDVTSTETERLQFGFRRINQCNQCSVSWQQYDADTTTERKVNANTR